MKQIVPPKLESCRIAGPCNEWSGAFVVQHGSARLRILVSNGMGRDHVSVSLHTRCPTWDEMCFVKSLCFDDEECVMQLHPPKSQWINNHPFCLHLWRPQTIDDIAQRKAEWGAEWNDEWTSPPAIPMPPGICVGIKELGNLT